MGVAGGAVVVRGGFVGVVEVVEVEVAEVVVEVVEGVGEVVEVAALVVIWPICGLAAARLRADACSEARTDSVRWMMRGMRASFEVRSSSAIMLLVWDIADRASASATCRSAAIFSSPSSFPIGPSPRCTRCATAAVDSKVWTSGPERSRALSIRAVKLTAALRTSSSSGSALD